MRNSYTPFVRLQTQLSACEDIRGTGRVQTIMINVGFVLLGGWGRMACVYGVKTLMRAVNAGGEDIQTVC